MFKWENLRPKIPSILILFIVFFQLILSYQGFDMCDEGASLSFYQQFFHHPESVEYYFVYWLSGLFGGLWYELFPSGGILWFRILAVIVNTSSFLISYHLLKKFMDPIWAMAGLIMVIFANDYGYLLFYHNPLTGFLSVSIVFLLVQGLIARRAVMVFFAGFLCAMNVFARIPNILFFLVIICIPFYHYLKFKTISASYKEIFSFLGGGMAGAFFILLIMLVLGQLSIFTESISSIVSSGTSESSNHNIFFLVEQYLLSYKRAVKMFVIGVGCAVVILVTLRSIKSHRIWQTVFMLLAIITIAYFFNFRNVEFLYLLSFLAAAGILFSRFNPEIKLLSLAAIMMALLLPMGSDGGIRNSGYMAIWISVPLFFHYILNLEKPFSGLYSQVFKVSNSLLQRALIILLLAFLFRKAYNISNEAYFDYGSRFHKIYTIENGLANNILTTEPRSVITNEILKELDNFVSPGDYLLAYDKLPMIHFLTHTKPYMYNPWVWVYDEDTFQQKLKKAEAEIETLPIVLQQKFETIRTFSEPMDDYMDASKPETYRFNSGRTTAMNAFLRRNDYEVVWSNNYFNILRAK